MLRAIVLFVLTYSVPVPDRLPAPVLMLLREECIRLEIMDARESPWLLAPGQMTGYDIRLLRIRYWKLKDAPPLSDASLFPCQEVIQQCMDFNRECKKNLESAPWLWRDEGCVRECLNEFDACYNTYDTLRDVKNEYYYTVVRREALQSLRDDLLGPQQFYNGGLPPYVPVEYFNIYH